MGILERVERIHRSLGNVPTFCKKCGLEETMKFYDGDNETLPKGSFTTKCGCGTWIYRFHNITRDPDPNNKSSYFTKAFISAQHYDKDYKNKDGLERMGFKKNGEGKYVK